MFRSQGLSVQVHIILRLIISTLHNSKLEGIWHRSNTASERSDREPRWQGNWMPNIHQMDPRQMQHPLAEKVFHV